MIDMVEKYGYDTAIQVLNDTDKVKTIRDANRLAEKYKKKKGKKYESDT